MEKLDFIKIKEIGGDETDLIYVDFDSDGNSEYNKTHSEIKAPTVFTKNVRLTEDYDVDNIISEYVEIINGYKHEQEFKIQEDYDNNRKSTVVTIASSYIAVTGKIGLGNLMFISEDNYNKYSLGEIESIRTNFDVLFNDDIDGIIIGRRTPIDQPGIILVKNNEHYKLMEIGFYPSKQFAKITLK